MRFIKWQSLISVLGDENCITVNRGEFLEKMDSWSTGGRNSFGGHNAIT